MSISRLIINTYESNIEESKNIFEKLIEKKLFNFHLFLYTKLNKILDYDPDYISTIYKYVIGNIENQDGKLVTTKPIYKTDIHLLEKFNKIYLKKQGFNALETLIKSLNLQAILERSSRKSIINENNFINENYIEKFELNQNEAKIITDYSYIWGDQEYMRYNLYGLVTDVFDYIFELNNESEIDKVIELFTKHAFVADLWRRLLITISNNPVLYEKYLLQILTNKTFLTSIDIARIYGKLLKESLLLLKESLLLLKEQEINQVEELIIKLPQDRFYVKKLGLSYLKSRRELLIDLFPDDILKCPKSKKIKEKNKQNNINYSEDVEKSNVVELISRTIGKYEIYEIQGIQIEDKEKQLIDLFEPLEQFNSKWLNSAPDKDSIDKIKPKLLKLHFNLKTQTNSEINSKVLDKSWTLIAETLSAICTGSYTFENDLCLQEKIKELIYECIEIPSKPFDDTNLRKDYLNYRTSVNKSVEALVNYYRFINDSEIFEKLKVYAENKDSSIRNNIVYSIFGFSPFKKEFFDLIKIIIKNNEPIFEINYWIFWNTLKLIFNFESESIEILELIESKNSDKKLDFYKREISDPISLLVNLAIYWNNKWASDKLDSFFENIDEYSEFYSSIVWSAFNNIKFNSTSNIGKDEKEAILTRFCNLIDKLFKTLQDNLSSMLKERYDRNDEDEKVDIISESINMFFTMSMSIQENNLEIQEDLLYKLNNSLLYIRKILENDEISHKKSLNMANYVKLNNIILKESNLNNIIKNIEVLSKYIISETDNNSEDFYSNYQLVKEFISVISEINQKPKLMNEIKKDQISLMKFINIINELAKTDHIEAIELVWTLN